MSWLFSFFLFFSLSIFGGRGFCQESSVQKEERLLDDLEQVKEIDHKIHESLPLILNYRGEGGIFTMPTARMRSEGSVSLGFSYLPPYRIYHVGFQYFHHVELTGNYRIFHGILEPNFGRRGFGDDAERSLNMKVSLIRKEDGIPFLPEIAMGLEDFLGTKRFHSFYLVTTKELLNSHLELSLGIGSGRIRGIFGGIVYSPFYRQKHLFKDFSFAMEYDGNNYKSHPSEHPKGRSVRSHINAGIHYRITPGFHLAVSSLRGEEIAALCAFDYNLGKVEGLFPKFGDPNLYAAPIDTEPLSGKRCEEELTQELCHAFHCQRLELMSLYLQIDEEKKKHLWMKVINISYREEDQIRRRVQHLLSSLLPQDIVSATLVVEADGLAIHQYRFFRKDLNRWSQGEIGDYEMSLLSPLQEISRSPSSYEDALLYYHRKKSIWIWTLKPGFVSYFGTTSGKFKYDLNLTTGPQGYLMDQIYYDCSVGYILASSTQGMQGRDVLNPSHLLQVRSDTIRYNRKQSLQLMTGYLQRHWNCGGGFFSRVSLGYFEVAYAGAALEALFYPVSSVCAVGIEGACLMKRKYKGLFFQRKIRKLSNNNILQHIPYIGVQYFLELYYDFQPLETFFRISLGQFLARDKGIRMEWTRYFSSGFRFSLWYTITDGGDRINGKRYYDKGFAFSLPLDWFMNKSSRTRVGYGMSAWLRDVGARAKTGKSLYPLIHDERENLH